MEINSWSQLTLEEKNLVIKVLASIFTTVGSSAATAENWYNSGYVKLDREIEKCTIRGLDNPNIKDKYIDLAVINY